MFSCEGLLQAKYRFETFLTGEQAHLPITYHHYLALIVTILSSRLQQLWAASTSGIEQSISFWKKGETSLGST
jgi:hypothetical protein